jgi:hypothetical protein
MAEAVRNPVFTLPLSNHRKTELEFVDYVDLFLHLSTMVEHTNVNYWILLRKFQR